MHKVLALLFFASAVFATSLSAADLSGAWSLSADIAGNAVAATCTFKHVDKAITGSCKGDLGDSMVSGSADGQKVGFKYDIDVQGMVFTLVYDGTLDDSGKAMKGTVNVAGVADGLFTAKKQ